MKKAFYLFLLIPLLGAGCFNKAPNVVDDATSPDSPDGTVSGVETAAETQEMTVLDYINGDAVPVYEDGELQSLRSGATNIYVISPLPGEVVGDSFAIEGNARVFENVVSYRVKDESGSAVLTGFDTANSADIGLYGAYSLAVDLSNYPDGLYTIEVYWESAKDGSDADLVSYVVQKQ